MRVSRSGSFLKPFRHAASLVLAAALFAPPPAKAQIAQEAVDLSVVAQIRAEGLERSQLEETIRYLTDVIGPRLTGSPGMTRANQWTAEKFREWGLENVVIEPWGEFGRGWQREYYSGQILTPFAQPLHAQPVSWTGSTDGAVRGRAMILSVSSVEDVEQYRGRLEGAFILMQDPSEINPEYESESRRLSLESLLPENGEEPQGRFGSFTPEQIRAFFAQRRRAAEVRNAVGAMAQAEGALAILRPASRAYGILSSVNGNSAGRVAGSPEPLPQLIIAPEQYGEIHRNVTNGTEVELEIEVRNRFFEDDLNAYNSLGEIRGSDKADELIMIGAHLDSWHMGTGATDNAAGSVVMMEAMRILKALNLQPRRTIRIALWSGEEQGLFGSEGWLEHHPEEHSRISAYLNVDNGTGRIRGIWNQSNEAATPIFEQLLWPFRDLGVVAVKSGDTGGTDHLSFDAVGIPGFNFIQDPIEYRQRTHHTYLDTFDHLVIDDLKQAAVVVAATMYHLAMRDKMMPRKGGRASTQP